MKKLLFIFCCFLPLLIVAQVNDGETNTDTIPTGKITIFHYLQQDSILRIHFKTNLKELNKFEEEKEEHRAIMTLKNAPSKDTIWKVKLKQRGKLRRDICKYKPLRIDFSKKTLAKKNLASLDDIKLVLSCKGKESGDNQALKEYLAYRLFNLLTEKSYQVQLMHAVFEDSLSTDSYDIYGFLLESAKAMGVRNEVLISEKKGLTTNNLYEKDYLLVAVFQYFIGNPDWNIKLAHNIKFSKEPGGELYTPIPYDFDFSGLVNAYYAAPDENFPIKEVTERLFMGNYTNETLLQEVIQLFHDKKEEMENLVLNFSYLSEKERKKTWHYLAEFFEQTKNPNNLTRIFPKETIFQDIMVLDRRKIKPKNE